MRVTLESDDSYHSFPGSGYKWVSSGYGFCFWEEYSSVVSHDRTTVVRCPDLPDGGFFDASAGTV